MRKIILQAPGSNKNNLCKNRNIALIDWEYQELSLGDEKQALRQIKKSVEESLNRQATPFLLGGEHGLMLGAFSAIHKRYPQVCIIHFDARADLHDEFLYERFTHPCIMRRCWELTGDGRIYQFGIRAGNRDEFRWAQRHVSLRRFDFEGLENILENLKRTPVYFTIDLDILNPEFFPGAILPEAGGVRPEELTRAACQVCSKAWIVGCDVCEQSQCCDPTGISAEIVKNIITEMLASLQKK